jgi:membrane peptidoglycan carboxypeptidase
MFCIYWIPACTLFGLNRCHCIRYIISDVCYGSLENMDGHFCGRMFDTSNEDKSEFCVGCTKSLTTGAWTYTSAEDIWGIPIAGHSSIYRTLNQVLM